MALRAGSFVILLLLIAASVVSGAENCPGYLPVPVVSTIDIDHDPAAAADPRRAAVNRSMLAPVTSFMMYLETSLDRETTAAELACPAQMLQQWAVAGAILKPSPNEPSRVARAFMTTGFGMIILKFKLRGVAITPEVAKWLAQLSAVVRQDFRGSHDTVYPYTGVTAAISAVINHDAESVQYQDEVWANYTAGIRPNGTIPAELKKGSRALIYHQMAANGLMMLHHLRHYALGRPDEPAQVARLKLLLNLVGKSLCHPQTLAAAAHSRQDKPGTWGFRLAFPFDDDDLVPETWTTCGPENLDYFDVTGGGDTRISAQAVRAVRHRKPQS